MGNTADLAAKAQVGSMNSTARHWQQLAQGRVAGAKEMTQATRTHLTLRSIYTFIRVTIVAWASDIYLIFDRRPSFFAQRGLSFLLPWALRVRVIELRLGSCSQSLNLAQSQLGIPEIFYVLLVAFCQKARFPGPVKLDAAALLPQQLTVTDSRNSTVFNKTFDIVANMLCP
jgi:hypothetical protein